MKEMKRSEGLNDKNYFSTGRPQSDAYILNAFPKGDIKSDT
jgi:hypothetical protein